MALTSSAATHTVQFRVMDPRMSDPTYRIEVQATRAEIDALVKDGYLIGYDWFTAEQIKRFRSALDRIYTEEPFDPDDRIDRYGGWRYFRFLLDKDPAFLDLLRVTPAMTIAQAVLGPLVQLDHVDGKYGPERLSDQFVPWHIHHRVIPDPIPPFFSYPHAIHCLLYLDDVDERNGCLCVVPGSHNLPHLSYVQDEHGDRPDQMPLSVRAGGCVLIHANLWHRVLPSTSRGGQRRLIIFGYLPTWMKAGEEGTAPRERITDELRSTGDSLTRQLLGEFYWG